jgi:hypothetical protein
VIPDTPEWNFFLKINPVSTLTLTAERAAIDRPIPAAEWEGVMSVVTLSSLATPLSVLDHSFITGTKHLIQYVLHDSVRLM